MLEEWEIQGIDMKSIEEYYYHQSGMESLELSKQEAKDNPVKSSFASFGDKFIGNISTGIYETGCYVTGKTVDREAAWYFPVHRADVTRNTVGETISNTVGETISNTVGGKKGEYAAKGYQVLMTAGDIATMMAADAVVGGAAV